VEPPKERWTGSNRLDQGRDSSTPRLSTTERSGLDTLDVGARVKDCGIAEDRPAREAGHRFR
jgi:hypothetical protein